MTLGREHCAHTPGGTVPATWERLGQGAWHGKYASVGAKRFPRSPPGHGRPRFRCRARTTVRLTAWGGSHASLVQKRTARYQHKTIPYGGPRDLQAEPRATPPPNGRGQKKRAHNHPLATSSRSSCDFSTVTPPRHTNRASSTRRLTRSEAAKPCRPLSFSIPRPSPAYVACDGRHGCPRNAPRANHHGSQRRGEALKVNISAGEGLQNVLKSNLGPLGTIKMYPFPWLACAFFAVWLTSLFAGSWTVPDRYPDGSRP